MPATFGRVGALDRYGGIDPLEPLAALGIEDVTDVQPVSGGMDTLIWRVNTTGGMYALRLFRPDQQDQWSKEVQVMRVLGDLGMPVPLVAAHGLWDSRPAMLMEWCEGRTVLDEVLAYPERIGALGTSMGRLHAHLHAVSLPREYWEDHRTWLHMAGPDEVELQTRLREIGLRDGHPLHLDFHPLNVLCVGDQATVVLDWANMTVGDPRADIARTRSIFRLVSAPPAAVSSDFASIRTAVERAWMDGYTRSAGPIADMLLFDIWAGVVFIRDMEKYLGRSDFWMEAADFDRAREYVAALKRRAGLSPEY
jgi:aminoglycoside phosphotransferase (APT) family kinase protein